MEQPRRGRWRLETWSLILTIIFSLVLGHCQAAQSGGANNALDGTNDQPGVWYTSVCEGEAMDLQCPGGGVILIESANFGRTDDQTCLGRGPIDDTDCRLHTTFDLVTSMCDYQKVCSIRATASIFGNPCPGTFKYLAVVYECIDPPPPPAVTTSTTVPPSTPSPPGSSTETVSVTNSSVLVDMGTPSYEPPTTRPVTEAATEKQEVLPTTKPPMNVCPTTSRRGISWPSTTAGTVVDTNCPEGATGYARWECTGNGGSPAAWASSGPDLSRCQSEWLNNITQLDGKGAPEVSTAIVTEIDNGEVYGSDIFTVADFMSASIDPFEDSLQGLEEEERYEETHKVSQNYLEITSIFLDNSNIDSWRDMGDVVQSESAANILSSVEESALLWADTIELTNAEEQMTVTLEESNVVMSIMVQDSSHGNPVDAVFPSEHSVTSSRWLGIEDQIIIPRENFGDSHAGKSKAVFLAYNNIHEYLGNHPPKTKEKPDAPYVNSRIMSASLDSADELTKLKKPVTITLAHITVDNATSPTCSFWDFKMGSIGDWSDKGCKVIRTNSTHTVCSCNHLTNFAILMNYKAVQVAAPHVFALSMITYFGFIISCVCLLLAFITFCLFKNLQNDRTTIHKNLCLTLMLAEIIFMAGIAQTQIKILCSIIAMLLHYFFLSAFAWMCLEGIQLYVMLVEVFEAESSRRKYYYPFGYGLPAVIIAVSAALNFDGYGTEEFCWLSTSDNFIWAFIAPICLIIAVNTIFLTMAMYIMCRHSKLQTNPKEKNTGEQIAVGTTRMDYAASWMRGAMVLMCLLGITWAFGLAYVDANTVIFAYIFTVFNALQGVFIYVFHCLMNDKVRKEYRRYIRNSTWLPACIRDNYGGIFSSNSNQQQSFRSSSSGRGRVSDSKRLSNNTTGSYSFDHRRISGASNCRCSGEYMPIQSPPPVDEARVASYVYEEVPECGFLSTHIVDEAERALREDALRQAAADPAPRGDEGIGLELEGHPSWSQKPSVVVANADGDLARFSKNDLRAGNSAVPLMRESGLGNETDGSQPASPDSDSLPTISFNVQRSSPDLSNLASLKPLLKGSRDDRRRESGIGASQSEGDQSSTSSDQMCPRSPVVTPEIPAQAHIYPNHSHTSMPDLVHPNNKGGRRAQFNEIPAGGGSLRPGFLPKKSNSTAGVGESRRPHSASRPDHSISMETELYVPQTLSRLETMI